MYSCQSLTCNVDLVLFLISLRNLTITPGGVWDEQEPLFLPSWLLEWEIHHVPRALGAVHPPGGASQEQPCREQGWVMLCERIHRNFRTL